MRFARFVFFDVLLALAVATTPGLAQGTGTPAPAPVVSAAPSDVAVPAYQYFAYTGLSYDWIGKAPASITGFGLRIGSSNAFNVTEVATSVLGGVTQASISTGVEYQVACAGGFCFQGIGSAGVTTNGGVTLGNFSGGFGMTYDIGQVVTKGKFSLIAAGQFRILSITATQVKPVYGIEFRKTF